MAEQVKIGQKNPLWGLSAEAFNQFMGLVCMGVERMSSRQRTMFRRGSKAYCRAMNNRWPHGKPEELCKQEMEQAEFKRKTGIILPKDIIIKPGEKK